jgi:hypothetical protein
MPKSVRWLDHAWAQLTAMPEQLRKDALEVSSRLMADAYPEGWRVYEAVPDTYRLDTPRISLYYRIIGADVDVVRVEPNS